MLYYIFNYNISNGKTNINYNDTNNSYAYTHCAICSDFTHKTKTMLKPNNEPLS